MKLGVRTAASAARLGLAVLTVAVALVVWGCCSGDGGRPPGGRLIAISGVADGDSSFLLHDGWDSGRCRNALRKDALVPGQMRIPDPVSPCDSLRVAVFARGVAPTARAVAAARWDAVLRPPDRLQVEIWLVARPTQQWVRRRAMQHLGTANALFAELPIGVYLDTVASERIHWVTDARDSTAVGTHCRNAPDIANSPRVYRSGRVNLYFIASYGDATSIGYNCMGYQNHSEIVFIEYGEAVKATSVATLAHEVGHALGLVTPLAYSGHPDQTPGLNEVSDYNLMCSGVWDVRDITLAQAYRMHFDTLSWLNRDHQPSDPRIGAVFETCQDAAAAVQPCPALGFGRIRIRTDATEQGESSAHALLRHPETRPLLAWLTCHDCTALHVTGLRNTMRVLGASPAGGLQWLDSLARYVRFGPVGANLMPFEAANERTFSRVERHLRTMGSSGQVGSRGQFLSPLRAGIASLWKRRAALALGHVRADGRAPTQLRQEAMARLQYLATLKLPPRVRAAVIYGRDSIPNDPGR